MSDDPDTANGARRLVMGVVVAAVVVALALRTPENGWGWTIWFASAVGIVVLRSPFARATRDNTITDDRQGTTESALLALVGVAGGVIPLVHLLTGVFDAADSALAAWTYAVGAALAVLGLWLFWRSHADLGRNWSVTLQVRDEHTLITDGVYSRVRHPMYTSLLLVYGSTPLVLHNWIAGWSGLIGFALLCVARIPHEESMMRTHFGDEYVRYTRRTGRLLPSVTRG